MNLPTTTEVAAHDRRSSTKVSDRRRRALSRVAEQCFAIVMRVIPRNYRFDVALMLARITVPLFRNSRAYREQEAMKFHRPTEIALHLIMNAMTKNGTWFDPRFEVEGFENFEHAFAAGKGVL